MNAIVPLRQSTDVTIIVGPFVQAANGVTPITNLALADLGARILRAGVAAIDISARTWTHVYGGYYELGLLAADVATLGLIRIVFSAPGTICPIWNWANILDQAIYDAFETEGGISSLRATLVLGPINVGVPMNPISPQIKLAAFRRENRTHTITLVDANGAPVTFPENAKFVVGTSLDDSQALFVVEDGITSDANTGQIPTTQENNDRDPTQTGYIWRLWDTDADSVVAHGPYAILPTSEESE